MVLFPSGNIPSPSIDPTVQDRAGGMVVVWGIAAGILLSLLLCLPEYLLRVSLFSGSWMAIFSSTLWLSNIGVLFTIFGAGPALVYLSLSRIDPVVQSDTRLRDRLLPGLGALSGSYFAVFFGSFVLERVIPFPPDAGLWAAVQCCLILGVFLALRMWYARHYAISLRWFPGRSEEMTFVLIVLFALGAIAMNFPRIFAGSVL